MDSLKVNDNINLYYVPMTKLKTTSIGVYIHRPLTEEEVSKNALLPYVMKRGCALCPESGSVFRYLENLYGAGLGSGVFKRGGDHIINFMAETICDEYATNGETLAADCMRLLMSMLFEPSSFDGVTVAQEKKNALDRITAEINDKRQYAQLRCSEEMCEGDSFALSCLGTKEGVEAITADILKEHYDKIITSSPIDIYVCGSADIDALASLVKEYTKDMTFTAAEIPRSELISGRGDVKRVTDNMDVVQGKLSMGFCTGTAADSEDYVKLMVMNSVYGGGAHSKLFNNVREKLSLCYYASSSLVRNKGIMFVNAGIEFQNFDKAYNEILAQLEAVKNGDISELEFESSKSALINQIEAYKDNQTTMQFYLLGERIAGTNYGIDEIKDMINNVTLDDVKEAAAKIKLDTVYFLTGKGGIRSWN